jgi:anti-anti-sigma factor
MAAAQVLDLGILTIRSRRDGAAHVLTIAGELDVASAPGVEAELRCIEGATTLLTSIVIDLRGLTFIDTTGMRLLIEANHRAGGDVRARAPPAGRTRRSRLSDRRHRHRAAVPARPRRGGCLTRTAAPVTPRPPSLPRPTARPAPTASPVVTSSR